jgi:hypothetical protein
MLFYTSFYQMVVVFASFPGAFSNFQIVAQTFQWMQFLVLVRQQVSRMSSRECVAIPQVLIPLRNQWDALQCFGRVDIPCDPSAPCDCHIAWVYFLLFIVSYVAQSFFSLGVVKYGNAAFSFVVSTLSTPLTEFAFAWPLLMGGNVEPLSVWNYGSLAVLLLGVVLYRVFDKKSHGAANVTDVIFSEHNSEKPIQTLHVVPVPGYYSFQASMFVKTQIPSKINSDETAYYTFP